MLTAVYQKIESRRNKNICSLYNNILNHHSTMINFLQSRLENPRKKELLNVARDLFVRLSPNEAIEETEAEYDQPPVKKQRQKNWIIFFPKIQALIQLPFRPKIF